MKIENEKKIKCLTEGQLGKGNTNRRWNVKTSLPEWFSTICMSSPGEVPRLANVPSVLHVYSMACVERGGGKRLSSLSCAPTTPEAATPAREPDGGHVTLTSPKPHHSTHNALGSDPHLNAEARLTYTGLILGLRPANERRRYFVTTSLIGWTQTLIYLMA